jgi:hypothetical protein
MIYKMAKKNVAITKKKKKQTWKSWLSSYILTNQLTTAQSFELLSLNIQDCCLLCQILIYETCLKKLNRYEQPPA